MSKEQKIVAGKNLLRKTSNTPLFVDSTNNKNVIDATCGSCVEICIPQDNNAKQGAPKPCSKANAVGAILLAL